MRRIQAIIVASICAAFSVALLAQSALARPTSELKIMIFPLECSVDLLHTGVTTFRQITPENCQDPDEEPGIPGDTGGTVPAPQQPPQVRVPWYGSAASPLAQMPVTTLPDSPEVKKTVIANQSHTHTADNLASDGQIRIMTIVIAAVSLLILLYSLVRLFIGRIGRR